MRFLPNARKLSQVDEEGDAADKATVEQMRTRAAETFGGVDIYVSNAARRLYKDFFTITDEDWDYYLNQQLTASWYLAKAFVPGMRDRGWGRVVHINGEDGWLGGWTRVPHSVGKGGLRTLTITGAVIHVNGGQWMFG